MAYEIVEDLSDYLREQGERVVHVDPEGMFVSIDLKEEWDYEPDPGNEFGAGRFDQMIDLVSVLPSEFTEFAIMMPDKENQTYKNFSFERREYLRQIYDTPSKRTLLKCGRQIEKTLRICSVVRRFNGAPVFAGDVREGDWLETLSTDGSHMTYGQVVWISRRYRKPCVRITTRQGHTTEVALTHPMRTWDTWTEAGQLRVKDKIAAVRKAGIFHAQWAPEKHRIRLTAYLIGDGHIGKSNGYIGFTQLPGPVLDEFLVDIGLAGGTYRINDATGGSRQAKQVVLHRNGMVRDWLQHDGLTGHNSRTKFVPYWVWGLSKEDTALFVNRLWATDGHVKQNTRSKYSLEYCSVSERLVRDVQALLWKFGIPSSVRKNWPNYWKDQGIEEYAYILRIETKEGVLRFLTQIACLGKSESCPIPEQLENNNRDTYPIEINGLIRRIIGSRGSVGRLGRSAEKSKSLRTAGLRETLKYPPTWQKLQQYVDFFKSDRRYDQLLVAELEKHIDTDLFWDEIESIEHIGDQECVDFEVEGTHNFVADGLVTHNSTMLGNKLLSYSCIVTALNSLYVSPTNQQSKVFSQDRLKEPIETSPFLKSWTTTKLSDNVFLKKFINRSQITLRYAYMNADRCRGIPSDIVCFDSAAQVLTRKGWKLVSELAIDDEVADVSDRGDVEWSNPYNIFSKEFTGEMVSFDHSRMHIRVTSDHQMVANFKIKPGLQRQDAYVFATAGDLADTKTMGFKMTCGASWLGQHPTERVFPGIPTAHGHNRKELHLNYQDFALLTGWYISEGHTQKYNSGKCRIPVISQNANRHLDEIVQTVERLGLSYRVHKDPRSDVRHVVINSAILGQYYAQLGKSRDKHIPREFFEYPALLSYVLRGIYLGDGCHHEGEEWWESTLRTRSRLLAEDVQEAWLRISRPAVIHTRMFVPAHQDNPNYALLEAEPMYEVCSYKRDYFIFWRGEFESKSRITVEAVSKERVYCFTVKNHRPIVKGDFGSQPIIIGQCVDELQDILTDNIPVIEETASHSELTISGERHKGGIFMYSGTPKSLDNTIEVYWNQYSTQNEWVVPCHNHAIFTGGGQLSRVHWNILTEDNIGLESLICERCGKKIDPQDEMAQWAALNPGIIKEIPKPYDGYRIPQLMVPWVSHQDILQKQKTYPRDRFYNEVLGLSYDSGTRPLTQQDVIDNCSQYLQLDEASLVKYKNYFGGAVPVYAGIDWGAGGENSYTVLTLGAYLDGKFQLFYYKRFEGRDSETQTQIEEIIRTIIFWNVKRVGVDYGGGLWPNDRLTSQFGMLRVAKYQYSNPGEKVRWEDGLKRFLVNRCEVMSDVFNAIKRRDVFRFPNWNQFKLPFGADFLNIFAEYNEQRRMIEYKKSPGTTDDSFHATLLCFLVSMLDVPRPDIIAPALTPRRQSL